MPPKMLVDGLDSIRTEKILKANKELRLSLLSKGEPLTIEAWGMSMYPFIKRGDRLKVVGLTLADKPRVGDIVAVHQQGSEREWFYIHRVIKVSGKDSETMILTKGDAADFPDEPCGRELIAGRVCSIERGLLTFNLRSDFWKPISFAIAALSKKYPAFLKSLSACFSLLMEWRLFPLKIKNRLIKGETISFNSEELILTLARMHLGQQLVSKAARLVKEGIDWEFACDLTIKSQSTKLVIDSLKILKQQVTIPEQVLERLRQAHFLTLAKTAVAHQDAISIASLFSRHNMPLIILKGTFLSERIYADISTRGISTDIDLLIREEDKEGAALLLKEAGYKKEASDEIGKWRWQNNFTKAGATMVDLHWDITMMGRNAERIRGLWSAARMIEKESYCYLELEEEALLLYLSSHLVNSNGWTQLKFLCDIHELLVAHGEKIDWQRLAGKAKKWQMAGSLFAALSLTEQVFGFVLPEIFSPEIKPNILKKTLIRSFLNRQVVLHNCLRRKLMDKFLSYIFFELVEASEVKDYLRILTRVFFPPMESLGNRGYITRFFNGLKKLLDMQINLCKNITN